MRGTKRISDVKTRQETLRFAREEFERNKGVEDIVRSYFTAVYKWPYGGSWGDGRHKSIVSQVSEVAVVVLDWRKWRVTGQVC